MGIVVVAGVVASLPPSLLVVGDLPPTPCSWGFCHPHHTLHSVLFSMCVLLFCFRLFWRLRVTGGLLCCLEMFKR